MLPKFSPSCASLGAVALSVLLCGCGGGEPDAPVADDADVDALRSLPYLDYSPEKADGKQGVVVLDRDRSSPGLNLVTYRHLCRAELIDDQGRVLHVWEQTPCHHWSNVALLPTGDLIVPGMDPIEGESSDDAEDSRDTLAARFLMRLDYQGNVVWKTHIPVHHDVGLNPRNQLVTLTTGYRAPKMNEGVDIHDGSIAVVTLDGELIEQLSLYDVFAANPDEFPLQKVGVRERQGLKELPLFHANAARWVDEKHLEGQHPIYDSGVVLVTLRHQNVVVAVNWDQKEIVWMWGRGELMGPHDGSVLDNGHVLIFDNGLGRGWSRVVEVDPLSGRIVWEYKAPNPKDFYTASQGCNQRLPNGNTLITSSEQGEVFEVTPEGDVVWRYLNPYLNEEGRRATIVRSERYPSDFLGGLLRPKEAE
jgi:outer membrane protein assembly factor BamB